MAIDPDKLLNRDFGSVRETYSKKDCILYALGVGMGPVSYTHLPLPTNREV